MKCLGPHQRCSGWRRSISSSDSAIDLVDRLQYSHSRELCDEMREMFGLPPLRPVPPSEVFQSEENNKVDKKMKMKKLGGAAVMLITVVAIVIGVVFAAKASFICSCLCPLYSLSNGAIEEGGSYGNLEPGG